MPIRTSFAALSYFCKEKTGVFLLYNTVLGLPGQTFLQTKYKNLRLHGKVHD